MPKYLLHIGPHKTGSTYLQAAFQALRPKLLERGIWYPEQWQGEDKLSHYKLASRLKGSLDTALADEFAALNVSHYETVLISAEDLVDLGAKNVQFFKSLLGNVGARVIFYCRRWSELLPSGWQEMVKHGHTLTLPELLTAHLANCSGSHVINYNVRLRGYAEHFGLSNLSLVSYSNIVDKGEDLFVNFCRNFLSWSDPPVPELGRPNASMDPLEVELIRALNAIEQSHGGELGVAVIRSYWQSRSKLDLSNLMAAMQSHIGRARIDEGQGPLQHLHGELFKQFGSLLVEPRSGPRLFAPKIADIPYVRQDYLLPEGISACLQDIYRRIRG